MAGSLHLGACGSYRHVDKIGKWARAGWTGYVKIYLTGDQVLRLLCIGWRCNLATVRSIQSTENSYDEPNPSHRAGRARASRHCGHGRFGARLPVGVAEEVIRNACAYELT